MDYQDYLDQLFNNKNKNIPQIANVQQQIPNVQQPIKIEKRINKKEEEEIDIDYIIENCPKVKIVREFLKEQLIEDDDELPDFLQ